MKPVKNLVFAALLVISIALNTFAGDVQVPGAPAPEPPPRVAVSNPEADTATPETDETADYLFLEVLTALLSVY